MITAVENGINFLTVLVEDGVQHFLRMNQNMRYGTTFTTQVFPIDYTKVLDGIGVKVVEARDRDELRKATEEAVSWSTKAPTVLRVKVNPNSVPSRLARR